MAPEESNAGDSLMGYRQSSDLGTLSKKEMARRQRELHKMLNALKATLRYNLDRSKLRILEELRFVLTESPDIVEVEHLERILGLMRVDTDCRRETWPAIQMYLPMTLQRMGIDTLLKNDYLGSHHLKARMDKYVLDSRAENSSIHDDLDSFMNDDPVHVACEYKQFGIPTCFGLRE